MAKPNTPLLSLEAHGTIGNALTHQGRGRVKIAREKPVLPYSLTLPQRYQRWLYEDYAYRWRQQSEATQATYRTAGVRFHRTGFQQWMSVMLSTLPDILGWWKLDEIGGAVAYDSSKNTNNGTIIGATPAECLINGGQYFITNDRISVPAPPCLDAMDTFTLEFFFNPSAINWYRGVIGKKFAIQIWQYSNTLNRFDCRVYNSVGAALRVVTGDFGAVQTWYMFHLVSELNQPLLAYKNGVQIGTSGGNIRTLPTATNANPLIFGYEDQQREYFTGHEDNIIIYNRVLDQAEMVRHSLRRWSL